MQKAKSQDSVQKFFISLLGLIALFAVLKELQHIFIPLILAYFLFFLFQPLNDFLVKKRIPYWLTVANNILIMVLLVWGFSRIIQASFEKFEAAYPIYTAKLNQIISRSAEALGLSDPLLIDFNFLSYLNSSLDLGGIATGFFSSTLSMVSTTFFILLFFLFISSGHHNIVDAIKDRYGKKYGGKGEEDDENNYIDETFKSIPLKIQRYIITKVLISTLTALSVGIVIWIFGIDFIIIWLVLTFLLNFIPTIGSIIAVILPTLLTLVQYESFGYPLLFAGIVALIQNIIGSILEPKILGNRLGLNPLVLLLSLLLWGYIWGIVGMFLSVPIAAVVKIIVSGSESKNLKFLSDIMG